VGIHHSLLALVDGSLNQLRLCLVNHAVLDDLLGLLLVHDLLGLLLVHDLLGLLLVNHTVLDDLLGLLVDDLLARSSSLG
jgi:hypothetical protein